VNVGVAGALVIYDRMLCLGTQAERLARPGVRIKDRPEQRF